MSTLYYLVIQANSKNNIDFFPCLNCSDVNECAVNNGDCDHNCTNNQGSYTCSCKRGYTLQGDAKSCKGKDNICIIRFNPHAGGG